MLVSAAVAVQETFFQEIIDDLSHWLPTQGPIKEFIHHNTLHAYQDRPFHVGVRVSRRMTGGRGNLKLHEYQDLYRHGEISDRALKWAVANVAHDSLDSAQLTKELLEPCVETEEVSSWLMRNGLRKKGWGAAGLAPEGQTYPAIFRIFGQYYDQGIATWPFPNSSEGLYNAVASLVEASWIPVRPFHTSVAKRLLRLPAEKALSEVLDAWLGDHKYYKRYLLETALGHPGWSGMIRQLELEPHSIVIPRPGRLIDALALELIAEYSLFFETLSKKGKSKALLLPDPEIDLTIPAEAANDHPVNRPTGLERRLEIWQEAYERTYLDSLALVLSQKKDSQKKETSETAAYQTIHCIDDRECSFRRHIEFIQPRCETFAWAGFFSIDCLFQGAHDTILHKHCPQPMKPRHVIQEILPSKRSRAQAVSRWLRSFHLSSHPNGLIRGWLLTHALGWVTAVRMGLEIFVGPGEDAATLGALGRMLPGSELILDKEKGYTLEEMADRVFGMLKNMGFLSKPRQGLTVIFGHGSTSANNPYFAAYDCGACSGKPGSPNSRAFAKMANDSRVREILKTRGLDLDGQWFVGALHDTTRDEVQYFDAQAIPGHFQKNFENLKEDVNQALLMNAKERCLKFAQLPPKLNPLKALTEVRHRSTSLFEPRPEMNHATNASAIVGRRELTRGIFLDRRAFLNSYDPTIDPEGIILTGILSAVVPVCGGINLEYFFSRTDPQIYGAGTKLPHNVSGLIGVLNGTTGDLLTGLPTQMTEIHPPLRLAIFVEQSDEVALLAAKRNPSVFEWIQNGWVRYLSIHPETGKIFEFRQDRMEKWT
ncbi:MAG: DUF2309 domain-containing protein [Bdellovibrionales bacterium]|nr:DUF2309 domain-containing protein [Bdellovibrionales bacterium]